MKLYRTTQGILIKHQQQYYLKQNQDWDQLVNQDYLYDQLLMQLGDRDKTDEGERLIEQHLLPPLGTQEIWASGVTYYRSRDARMEESKSSGGGSFYDRVYEADRPELFFKAPHYRAVGHRAKVRIREDSAWNVPEPEMTLYITSTGKIAGYTLGNDMSSRSIEGENPLYLPQAKSYNGSTALGPCLYISREPLSADTGIRLEILREGRTIFEGETAINQMKRSFADLVAYLYRECDFHQGAYLMTGTGIIPGHDFSLQSGDEIRIQSDPIGTLINFVA